MINDAQILSVGALTRQIKQLLDASFEQVWVSGEICNLKRASSGHVYLTLRDAEAQLRAVMWRSLAQRLKFDPHDGLEVIARGKLDVYAPHGEYKLVIEELQPKGLGPQELALRQLKEKLFRLGYFDPKRKKPLPAFPRRLALVTSPTGAAVRDMLKVLRSRWPDLEVFVCPVRVQGDGAGADIAAALHRLDRLYGNQALPVDVIVLGRGGGSSDDLSAFNEEVVAQAIFKCRVPVVSAVGHEIDTTIADLVADRRAATPTEAATLIVPDRGQVESDLADLWDRLRDGLNQRLALARQRLEDLAARRVFRQPLQRIREEEQRLDDRADRLHRAARQRLDRSRLQLTALADRLQTLSPLNVLGRGYSLTRTEADGAVVRDPRQVRPGQRVVTHLQHGRLLSRVEETVPADS